MNNVFRYTDKQKDWIKNNYKGISTEELTNKFNEKFNTMLKQSQLKAFKDNHKLRSGIWTIMTIEQDKWIRENVVGISCAELTDKFNKKFNTNITLAQMKTYKDTHKLKNNIAQKDRIHPSMKPIGYEIKKSTGYTYVKVAKATWMLKQRVMYEKYYGPIPKGYTIIFANGDKEDFSKDNLIAIKKSVQQIASLQGLFCEDVEATKTGLLIAQVTDKIINMKENNYV